MKIRKLKNTHPSIYSRAIELQIAHGNVPDDNLDIGTPQPEGNFWWSSSEEGFDVGSDVDSGNFDSWYEHHKLKPKTITDKKPRTLKSKIINVAPNLLRIAGIIFTTINFREIVTENTLIWIPGLAIFGLGELIDITKKINNE